MKNKIILMLFTAFTLLGASDGPGSQFAYNLIGFAGVLLLAYPTISIVSKWEFKE